MNKYFVLLTIALNVHSGINAQSMTESAPAQALSLQDGQIIAINKMVEEIKSRMSTFKIVEKFKSSTGYDIGYFKAGELQLITVYYKDTVTEKNFICYFQNGQLIYSVKLWTDIKTKDTLDYERYYLRNERFIAWFKFENSVERNSVAFKKLAHRMRDYIGDLKLEYMNMK